MVKEPCGETLVCCVLEKKEEAMRDRAGLKIYPWLELLGSSTVPPIAAVRQNLCFADIGMN